MAKTIDEYIAGVPKERLEPFLKLIEVVNNNIPKGFSHESSYGFPGWVVPLSKYADGYHCKKNTALPFISVANQKGFIAFYHMGIYTDPELMQWFQEEYSKYSKYKLDMGKSCIRFKKVDQIPYELIGKLVKKMTMKRWISLYEDNLKK